MPQSNWYFIISALHTLHTVLCVCMSVWEVEADAAAAAAIVRYVLRSCVNPKHLHRCRRSHRLSSRSNYIILYILRVLGVCIYLYIVGLAYTKAYIVQIQLKPSLWLLQRRRRHVPVCLWAACSQITLGGFCTRARARVSALLSYTHAADRHTHTKLLYIIAMYLCSQTNRNFGVSLDREQTFRAYVAFLLLLTKCVVPLQRQTTKKNKSALAILISILNIYFSIGLRFSHTAQFSLLSSSVLFT